MEKENKELRQENLDLYEEKGKNRLETEELKLQLYHIKKFLQESSKQLEEMQEIDRRGWAETEKIKRRNVIINSLIKQCVDIKKELDESDKRI